MDLTISKEEAKDNTMGNKPFQINIVMLGTNLLNDKALFAKLLTALEGYPKITPARWSSEERGTTGELNDV